MKNEIIIINGIRAYEGENRVAYLGLEEVARGLGWTRVANSGNEVVMWSRVENYLKDISYTQVCTDRKDEFIPENVFYKLCMKANNEVARKFQDLVCDEILPQIRQTGGYIPHNEEDTDEEILAKALLVAQKTIERKNERIKSLEQKVEQDKPLVEFANQVSNNSDLILVREFAKLLADENIKMGEKRLYQWFREHGHILKGKTEPTQKSIEQGLFKVIERVVKTPYGERLTRTTKLTGRGQIYFTEKLRAEIKEGL